MLKRYTGVIYMYKSPSGKCYIGQTVRPKFRRNEHTSRAYSGSDLPFHRAIRKYGITKLEYTILSTICSFSLDILNESLSALEQYFIVKYNSRVPNGYNVTEGGEGNLGLTHSPETRAKISNARKGSKASPETRIKLSSWQIGKKLSAETREKIRSSHLGKLCKGRPCIQLSMNGDIIKEYEKIKDASKATGICASAISLVLSERRSTAGGYKWKYKEE
jgi:group I intron endonuclease